MPKPLDRALEALYPGLRIEGRHEPPSVSMDLGMEPDPDWRYIDQAGHLHAYVDYGDKIRPALPTLVWVIDSPGDDEFPETGHYECKVCRKEAAKRKAPDTPHSRAAATKALRRRTVEPGRRRAKPGTTKPGPVRITVTFIDSGRAFDLPPADLDALVSAPRRHAEQYLADHPDLEIPGELVFENGGARYNGVPVDEATGYEIAARLGLRAPTT